MGTFNEMVNLKNNLEDTLRVVLEDPGFSQLDPSTQAAVQSFFQLEAEPEQDLLDLNDDKPLKLDMGPGWHGNTPNGPWEGD